MAEMMTDVGLTFDDVLLLPEYSEVLPTTVNVETRLSRQIVLKIPLLSAAMDSVTESRMAMAMAQIGGIGVIHKNLSPQDQAIEVERVKKSEWGMILNPVTVGPEQQLTEALALMQKFRISGVPVTESGKLVGMLTNRDLQFIENLNQPVSSVMTHENLITAVEGITLEEAKGILATHRIEKLPVVDKNGLLKGLITIRDILKRTEFPNANKDRYGRLIVGAAVGVGADLQIRAGLLAEAGVDVFFVDSAHGHSKGVLEVVRWLKRQYPQHDVVGGNVATAAGAQALIEAGVDAVKVGIGPGSICTTRIVAGVGVPQITAVMDAYKVCSKFNVPVISDGGVRFSGDVTKALAVGASSVMIGSLFAGTDEAPGETILLQGRSYKVYRGMGSLGAMKQGSKDRYFQGDVEASKLVPEGVEARVPYRGSILNIVHQMVGGLRSGMGYLGAATIGDLKSAKMMRISAAGMSESHAHNVTIVKEPPNYQLS